MSKKERTQANLDKKKLCQRTFINGNNHFIDNNDDEAEIDIKSMQRKFITGKNYFTENDNQEDMPDEALASRIFINGNNHFMVDCNSSNDTFLEKISDVHMVTEKSVSNSHISNPDIQSEEATTIKESPRQSSKVNLDYMAEEILKNLKIIRHDGNLYRYTGKSYQIIKNDEELLCLIRSHVSHDAFGSLSLNRFNDLLRFLKADNRLIPDSYEKKLKESEYLIAFQNGILDLRSMELHCYSENYLVFYELDTDWKENGHPKRFLKFLKTASGGCEAISQRILEALGYLLSAVNKGKYFFVMGTASDSGKSTLAEMLQNIIGSKYIAHLSPYQMGNRFALGDIHGKTLNLSMDLPNGKLTPVVVSTIKQITGGDIITTEQKYERAKDVHSNMRFLFASNYPISISGEDNDEAFWNRMVIIPFLYSVDRNDMEYDLIEKLLKEKKDIISLCLNAFHAVLQKNCSFSKCEAADDMKRQWRQGEDDFSCNMQKFISDCIDITGNSGDTAYAQDIYDAYRKYCQNHIWGCMAYTSFLKWFENNLPECEKKRIHHTGCNPKAGFTKIKLKQLENLN